MIVVERTKPDQVRAIAFELNPLVPSASRSRETSRFSRSIRSARSAPCPGPPSARFQGFCGNPLEGFYLLVSPLRELCVLCLSCQCIFAHRP